MKCGLCSSDDIAQEGPVLVCVECEARKLPECDWSNHMGLRSALDDLPDALY